jgi:cytokinin dehydrogenase
MVNRRQVLTGLGAGFIGAGFIAGFDPHRRRWVTEAEGASFNGLPELEGSLVTDPASLATFADDVGNIVRQTPVAVLVPGSVRDIQRMLRFCSQRGIAVAARGQGHTTFGQSQASGGLVIDMRALGTIHSIEPETIEGDVVQGARAVVDAGVTWKTLVTATLAQGLRPPALTGYTNLSVGGTLSVGGISVSNRAGAQVDNVKELSVVTGDGRLVRCSRQRNRVLFEGVLAGLGQCGIITRAVLELVPAEPQARSFLATYTDGAAFFSDLRTLLARRELDDLYLLGAPAEQGGWIYQLNAARFFDPEGTAPDPAELFRDLNVDPTAIAITDETHLNYVLRVDQAIDFFQSLGLWDDVLHPWFDVWLPEDETESYVTRTLEQLTPEDVGATGFLLLIPQERCRLQRPLLRVPSSGDWVFLFDILTAAAAPGPNPGFEARMLARNRRLYDLARSIGGTKYPIGAIPLQAGDWQQHYGEVFERFAALKQRFDPAGILTPGPGIFA